MMANMRVGTGRKKNKGCYALRIAICAALCAALCVCGIAGCSGKSDNPVKIATKPFVEQYILGEMLALIIENEAGYKVEITKGIAGGTSNIQPAMEKGEFDLYPEYTSTGYVAVLGHSAKGVSDNEIWETLNREYQEKFNMRWIGEYGFNNTYCVAVRGDIARKYNLKKTSDMTAVAGELVFGGNPDYIEREDGFAALCGAYGLKFKKVTELDIGLRYTALESGDIDVANGFTTDGQLSAFDVVVLEDDLRLQLNYFASTVVRSDSIKKFPKLESALMKMDGLLTEAEISRMSYAVSVDGKDEKEIARSFLIEKGVLKS